MFKKRFLFTGIENLNDQLGVLMRDPSECGND